MPFPDENVDTKNMHIIFATSKGKIRKNNLEDFTSINTSGKIAMKLDSDEEEYRLKIKLFTTSCSVQIQSMELGNVIKMKQFEQKMNGKYSSEHFAEPVSYTHLPLPPIYSV